MENPSASERVATFRSDDERGSFRDGVGMDGEWEPK